MFGSTHSAVNFCAALHIKSDVSFFAGIVFFFSRINSASRTSERARSTYCIASGGRKVTRPISGHVFRFREASQCLFAERNARYLEKCLRTTKEK